MAWPKCTAEYERQVHAAGKVFIPQLPATTNLGPGVAGSPGARTVPTSRQRPVYELAPIAVQKEMGAVAMQLAVDLEAAKHPIKQTAKEVGNSLEDLFTQFAEKTGLDHGAAGVAAKALGIPLPVLLVVLGFILWGMLRQYKLVPPLNNVIS